MYKYSGKVRYEQDEWSKEGSIFPTEEKLKALEKLLTQGNLLIAEHWYLRGARSPDRMVVEDTDKLIDYLESNARAGDIISIYDLTEKSWSQNPLLMEGKCPDEDGEIPKKGPY